MSRTCKLTSCDMHCIFCVVFVGSHCRRRRTRTQTQRRPSKRGLSKSNKAAATPAPNEITVEDHSLHEDCGSSQTDDHLFSTSNFVEPEVSLSQLLVSKILYCCNHNRMLYVVVRHLDIRKNKLSVIKEHRNPSSQNYL